MKILFMLLMFFNSIVEPPDISYLRTLYADATQSEEKAKQLMEATKGENENSVIKGYAGAAKILMANHYFNPLSKYNSFCSGRDILEAAILSDSNNAELRYLRLSIQINAPDFLGYNKDIDQDKLYLNNCLGSIKDEQLKSLIKNYLKTI